MRYLILAILVLLALQGSTAPTSAQTAPYQPPQALQASWLQPGQLLVQWEQISAADKVTVMWCRAYDPNICKPYLEVFDHQPGPRYAVIPAEPGMVIRFAEWQAGDNTFKLLSWESGIAAPLYGTFAPIVVTP